jgi:uncharacterized protein DUF4159
MRFIFYIIVGWVLLFGELIFVSETSADDSKLTIPVIKYRGGNYKPRPEAVRSLMAQLARRTSIEVNRETVEIEITDPDLYRYPFIYLAGNEAFDPFSEKQLRILRHYLEFGGFLLIDDNSSKMRSEFDASVRKLISRLFPKIPLQKINRDHSIYRSFYLINRPAGRIVLNPFLEGISVKGRTVLVYSTNDLGGAWARDKLGHWSYDIIAGGTAQRQGSVRLAVNIVMYALTLDYKKDMVHLPIILERLRRRHSK